MVSIPVDANGRKRIPANAQTSVETLFAWCAEVLVTLHPKVAHLERQGDTYVTRNIQVDTFTDDDGDPAYGFRFYGKLAANYRTSGNPLYASMQELEAGTTVPTAYLAP